VANRVPLFAIESSFTDKAASHSLRVFRHLSSTSFTGPQEAFSQSSIRRCDQPDHPRGAKIIISINSRPVSDCGPGFDEHLGDLRWNHV